MTDDDLVVIDGSEVVKQKTANVLAVRFKCQLLNAAVLFAQSHNTPVGFLSTVHSHAGQVNWKLYSAQSRCECFFLPCVSPSCDRFSGWQDTLGHTSATLTEET